MTPDISVDDRLIVTAPPPEHPGLLPYQIPVSSGGALHNLYDFLIGKDRKTGQLESSHLAESWSMSPNGKFWAFTLKEDIPFYKLGKAREHILFKGEDVKHTWLLNSGMLSDNSFNSPSPSPPLRGVSDISVEGNEVTWILEVARPDLSEYLSEDWSFGIISKQHWDAVGGE